MRVIVVGAGINGVTAAIELRRRGHEIILVDPGPLPHALAASTDISKAVAQLMEQMKIHRARGTLD